jgi:hypothetical protein
MQEEVFPDIFLFVLHCKKSWRQSLPIDHLYSEGECVGGVSESVDLLSEYSIVCTHIIILMLTLHTVNLLPPK